MLQVLEKATRAFIGSEVLKNDPEYVKLWVSYVSAVELILRTEVRSSWRS